MRVLWAAVAAAGLLGLASAPGCRSKPGISEVVPDFGNVSGNDDVVIHGSGFKPGLVVYFGRKQVKSVVIESPERIRVKTPSGPEGKVDVVVTRDDGVSFVLEKGFTYRKEGTSPPSR